MNSTCVKGIIISLSSDREYWHLEGLPLRYEVDDTYGHVGILSYPS